MMGWRVRRKGSGGLGSRDGATHQTTPLVARLGAWFGHHRLVIADSSRRLAAAPAATAMTCLVIGIALALPGTFLLALDNLRGLVSDWDDSAQLSVFLEFGVDETNRDQLLMDLRARSDVAEIEVVSPEAALAELGAGFTDVLQGLEHNPLPTVLVVTPRASRDLDVVTKALFDELVDFPEVERVVLDQQWLQRLKELMLLADRATLALAALLGVGALLVLGNTIRLEIENRRDEIQVVMLVGGTDAFVRRPFLYMGFLYGLGGGVIAVLLVLAVSLWMAEPLGRLLALYGSEAQTLGPDPGLIALLTGAAAGLGLTGAWIAVDRHLERLQPL